MNILIIEDQKKAAQALQKGLESERFDVHIGRLRNKIDEPLTKKLLHTVRGIAFILSEEES